MIKNILKASFIGCLFFSQINAKIISNETVLVEENQYSLDEACKLLTSKKYPLNNIESINSIDCMGKTFNIIDFCEKKQPADPYLAKGYSAQGKIICASAKKVFIRYSCKHNSKYCEDSDIGCYKIGERLARRLQVYRASKTSNNVLNCYFTPKKLKNIPDLPLAI